MEVPLSSTEGLPPGFAETGASDILEPAAQERSRVLFLCTHNSARSQMAEGILRSLAFDLVEAASAGTRPSRVHPLAIQVMAERGIDISRQRSKHLDELVHERFTYVVTVCDDANETCPIFPHGAKKLHWSIPDPSAVAGEEEDRRRAFAAAADDLAGRIRGLLALLLEPQGVG
jgi:arsenate reductase (thioredoxin)